jgi:poly[(R)-3-hydroxyalkanoate] polymerase subunit PhaC
MKTPSFWNAAPPTPDYSAMGRAFVDMMQNAATAQRAFVERAMTPGASPADPAKAMEAMAALGWAVWSDPQKMVQAQADAVRLWGELVQNTARRAMGEDVAALAEPGKGDRRFKDADWDAAGFDFIKQAYLLMADRLEALVDEAPGLDPETKVRAAFLVRQFIAAASPTNFAATNPAVVRKTLETGGLNLMTGASHLLADAAEGQGIVRRRATEDFELGRTIAATPGAVVYQNEIMQLIQYAPTTDEVFRRPVLLIPPMVNKYYLFDLQPKTSFLKWLVDQGHTVFVISWANPDHTHRDKDLTAFVKEGAVDALRAIEDATGERAVDLIGFCLGGTLTSVALGYLQAIGEADRAASATVIAALTDFSDLGEWSAFLGEDDVESFAKYLAGKGYVEAHDLQRLFSVVRANDLVWGPFVAHYLLGEEAPPSDLLWWFNDGARMPEGLLNTYLREVVRGNGLSEGGKLAVDGHRVDLKAVKTPVHFVSMKDDHVSGWQATYKGASLFGGKVDFILGGSGHNAGVINPPHANKHGYWTGETLPDTADAWLEGATRNEGSWWPHWQAMLAKSQDKVKARVPGEGKLPALEAAPGSYVRVRH